MDPFENLLRAVFQVDDETFKDLRDESPSTRLYAALQIAKAANDMKNEGWDSVCTYMNADALRGTRSDPDWKVRRVGSVAIRRIADTMGPILGISRARIRTDPLYVCDVMQANNEQVSSIVKDTTLHGIERPDADRMRKFNN